MVAKGFIRRREWGVIFNGCRVSILQIKESYKWMRVFPGSESGKEPSCQCRRRKRHGFDPWVGKILRKRACQPTPVFLSRESHRQRSLAGYRPWHHKESASESQFLDLYEGSAPLTEGLQRVNEKVEAAQSPGCPRERCPQLAPKGPAARPASRPAGPAPAPGASLDVRDTRSP